MSASSTDTERREPRFDGVILAGGRSSRMGTDKAFLELPALAQPLVCVSRDALVGAGASTVRTIGGDLVRLAALGFDAVPDEHPDEGPLGGLIAGLRLAEVEGARGAPAVAGAGDPDGEDRIVVVLTCDLPAIGVAAVRTLVGALAADDGRADAAIAMLDGRRQILTAAYRLRSRRVLEAAFDAGERSVRRAVVPLSVIEVGGIDPDTLIDVDHPHDLDRWNR